MSRSPRTMELRLSIVTSVLFFIRTDAIPKQFTPQKGHIRHKRHKRHKERRFFYVPYVRYVLFVAYFVAAFASGSSRTGRPSFTFTSRSILRSVSGFSRSATLAFSRPCPSRSPL